MPTSIWCHRCPFQVLIEYLTLGLNFPIQKIRITLPGFCLISDHVACLWTRENTIHKKIALENKTVPIWWHWPAHSCLFSYPDTPIYSWLLWTQTSHKIYHMQESRLTLPWLEASYWVVLAKNIWLSYLPSSGPRRKWWLVSARGKVISFSVGYIGKTLHILQI